MTDHPDETTDSPAADALSPEAGSDRDQQRHHQDGPAVRHFAGEAAKLLRDLHIEEIRVLDVRGLSNLTDYIILGTGVSDRQIRSVGDKLEELGASLGFQRYGRETDSATTWLVVDFVDTIVHLFDAPTRSHYDLESLWGDAPEVAWADASE